MVTNCLFAKIIFSFVQWIHHKLMKLNFAMFLVLSLSSAWLQILWKTYSLWSKNGVLLSDSFAFTKPKSCKQTCSLSAVINVGDLSAFVTEWLGKNRECSKIMTENYMKRLERIDFTALTHFLRIHKSVPHKRRIDLLYFWDVYDVGLWEKISAEVRLIYVEQMSYKISSF